MEVIKPELEPIKRSTLDVGEVATYLGISKDKIYLMVRERSLPHFRVGSRILFRLDAIDDWINKMMMDSVEQ